MKMYRTILAGTDGSESSLRAVDRAAEMAHKCAGKLVLVCAYPTTHPLSGAAAVRDELIGAAAEVSGEESSKRVLAKAAERADTRGAVDLETVSIEGAPAASLLDEADRQGADLIVIGNRGLNTLTGRVLGSIPEAVFRKSRIDVLVVHSTTKG